MLKRISKGVTQNRLLKRPQRGEIFNWSMNWTWHRSCVYLWERNQIVVCSVETHTCFSHCHEKMPSRWQEWGGRKNSSLREWTMTQEICPGKHQGGEKAVGIYREVPPTLHHRSSKHVTLKILHQSKTSLLPCKVWSYLNPSNMFNCVKWLWSYLSICSHTWFRSSLTMD